MDSVNLPRDDNHSLDTFCNDFTLSKNVTMFVIKNDTRFVSTDETTDCSQYQDLLLNASPYLFPFILEYSLIATGVYAIMSSKISIGKYHDVIANINHIVEHYLNRYNPSWATISSDQSVENGVKVAQQMTSPTISTTNQTNFMQLP